MTYELNIKFQSNAAAADALSLLEVNTLCIKKSNNVALLKDPDLHSSYEYDIGVTRREGDELFVEIIFKSKPLYLALKSAFGCHIYSITDEADEKTSLEAIFKIANF
ncbi:hypothetical protein [Eleftheria terrae]|uniref:hypothetical protein n=1 Tax=Eleftheria terrae TaxID=1597781 RepID=UPI00263AF052|nr:hypothetical protein [Eleftheria terrae]WKB56197.1 hypothetical protein N7L95_29595 [Eleftheria terrae]